MLERFQNYIGGKFLDAGDGRTFDSLDPYAGAPWAAIPEGSVEDIDHAVAAARSALAGEWGKMTGFQRAALMRRLADLITENAERLARVEVRDNGKLYREMIGQLQGLGVWYQYFAGHADKIEGRVIPTDKPNYFCFTRREPVGVVGAITPWNSPLLLMTFKLAPGLAAGCTFVVKPSEHSPASTLAFAQVLHEAGFPDGVFNVVAGSEPRARRRPRRAQGRRQGRVHRLDRDGRARWPTPQRTTSTGSPSSWAASPRRSSSRTPTCPPRPTGSSRASSPPPARRAWPGPG